MKSCDKSDVTTSNAHSIRIQKKNVNTLLPVLNYTACINNSGFKLTQTIF